MSLFWKTGKRPSWLYPKKCLFWPRVLPFWCDSISQHLPLSVSESVIHWVIVLGFGDSYRILRACYFRRAPYLSSIICSAFTQIFFDFALDFCINCRLNNAAATLLLMQLPMKGSHWKKFFIWPAWPNVLSGSTWAPTPALARAIQSVVCEF